MKNIAKTFCNPWKNALPSLVVVSIFKIPDPFNNWSTIDAVTIGPIPSVVKNPNEAPSIIDKNSKLASADSSNPYNGTTPRTKNAINIAKVNLSFVLNGRYFSVGPFTSGRTDIIELKNDILIAQTSACTVYFLFCSLREERCFYLQ